MNLPSIAASQTSLVDIAYGVIRERIVHGSFPAGSKLVETRLASELGISRPPIREALRRLRQEGLIVDKPRRGAFVRDLTAADLVDLYNLRMGLEATAARLAVQRGATSTELHELTSQMAAAAEANDLDGVIDADLGYHQQICEMADNAQLSDVFQAVSGHVRMALAINDRAYARLSDVAASHSEITAAMDALDAAAAANAIEEHILDGAAVVLHDAGGSVDGLLRPRER